MDMSWTIRRFCRNMHSNKNHPRIRSLWLFRRNIPIHRFINSTSRPLYFRNSITPNSQFGSTLRIKSILDLPRLRRRKL